MLIIDKILSQLIYPLGFSLAALILAAVLLMMERRRLGLVIMLLGILWLGFWSIPLVSDAVRHTLERQYEQQAASAMPTADAIVVLGGGLGAVPLEWPYPDLAAAADRVWHAARLYHAGKAPLLIVSGGAMPWQGARRSEADAMLQFLTDLGVPAQAIRLEQESRNTRENALFTAALMETEHLERVLLVTSALHMPRAVAAFRAVNLEVIPAPTDFEVVPEPPHPLRLMPDAAALSDSTRALKEYLGLWVYRARGWAVR
ncbi:hypothetical protein CKO25_13585 [Thiocapsa imhoffii]|uniref:DUF218 domain-containing protein n=1 Tax=Thiocapsa imhoffii TaxID=382777 RepID=A0A9X0WJI6_9GAMM|nr:YdcF family protein [Thiocapsa imhoffii]MBK1645660.1 hypothetical protein [Thiocapsa imhoffii]